MESIMDVFQMTGYTTNRKTCGLVLEMDLLTILSYTTGTSSLLGHRAYLYNGLDNKVLS